MPGRCIERHICDPFYPPFQRFAATTCRAGIIPWFQRKDRFRMGTGIDSARGDAREPEQVHEEGGREARRVPLPPIVSQGR